MKITDMRFPALFVLTVLFMACQTTAQSPAELAKSFGDIPVKDEIEKVEKSAEEWKEELTQEEYQVLREEGTERAFSGDLLKVDEEGALTCAACGLPVFHTKHQFKSGTGWPSYYKPIEKGVVKYVADNAYGMQRVEIECGRCGSHLGHVFRDGPDPTGFRYCINSVSLDFEPQQD